MSTEGPDEFDPMMQSEALIALGHKLGLMERVRQVCQSVEIPIPGIVVVGEQSAGKSSLLENISGIKFPRDTTTCTRIPCILSLATNEECKEPRAMVSKNASFLSAEPCALHEVRKKIEAITEEVTSEQGYISEKPIYIKIVRGTGPQLSLIDLPGITHNASNMNNIHEVTKNLVEQYIKQEEMVILCVLPALSDFGNAEVIKLAQECDPAGNRTLGVVTKCDDAASVGSSDLVEKVQMSRPNDVKVKLGFHCVINRSQNDTDDIPHDKIWEREQALFKSSHLLKRIPPGQTGTRALMERIARIQEQQVDQFLPEIRDAVRSKINDLKKQQRQLPTYPKSDADCQRQLDIILRKINDDVQRRVRAEYISSDPAEKEMAIAPRVADMVTKFSESLRKGNPSWLEEKAIEQVEGYVQDFVNGYTVDNLVGPQVFVGIIKRVFVDDGFLADSAEDLADQVSDHLRRVLNNIIRHVLQLHGNGCPVLESYLMEVASNVIEDAQREANKLTRKLAEAQQVTSTTQGKYMMKLTQFRKSWFAKAVDRTRDLALFMLQDGNGDNSSDSQLPEAFKLMVEHAPDDPRKLAVLEICASLHVYTGFMIECFTDMTAKLIKYNLVETLAETFEFEGRSFKNTGIDIRKLFPVDKHLQEQEEHIQHAISELTIFKDEIAKLPVSRTFRFKPSAQSKLGQVTPMLAGTDQNKARPDGLAAELDVKAELEAVTKAGDDRLTVDTEAEEWRFAAETATPVDTVDLSPLDIGPNAGTQPSNLGGSSGEAEIVDAGLMAMVEVDSDW